MKNIIFVWAYILLMCCFYIYKNRDTMLNMDDRVSIVIALGRFPPLAEQFSKPNPVEEYISLIDYKKYQEQPESLKKVYQSIVNDNSNGCIYYFTLSFLIRAVGYNFWWLRFLSVFIGGVNLFMVFLLAKRLQMRTFFVWSSLVMISLNPIFIINVILIRSYMFALLGCLLSLYFLIGIISENSKRNLIYYFLSVLLAAGSHYFTFSVLAAEFVFIAWKWGRVPSKRRIFLLGYTCLLIIAAGWFYMAYPTAWNNLQYLIRDNLGIAHEYEGYLFSVPNLIKQWLNILTYYFGFTTDFLGRIRIVIKFFTAALFLLMVFRLWNSKNTEIPRMLAIILVFSMIFYSLQSVYEGQLINFIPKYLLAIVPIGVLGVNLVLSDTLTEKFNLDL